MPLSLVSIELCVDHNTFECSILLQIENFVSMVKVCAQFMMIWIISGPGPIFPDLCESVSVISTSLRAEELIGVIC